MSALKPLMEPALAKGMLTAEAWRKTFGKLGIAGTKLGSTTAIR